MPYNHPIVGPVGSIIYLYGLGKRKPSCLCMEQNQCSSLYNLQPSHNTHYSNPAPTISNFPVHTTEEALSVPAVSTCCDQYRCVQWTVGLQVVATFCNLFIVSIFRRIRKSAKSDCQLRQVCLCVFVSAWKNWAWTGRISWNLKTLRKSVENSSVTELWEGSE